MQQGSKLRLTGGQCDQKLSIGDLIFRTVHQLATRVLSGNYKENRDTTFVFKSFY